MGKKVIRKVNCKFNDDGAWCKCEKVKRSLFGFGARLCMEFNDKKCPYVEKYPRPSAPPAPVPKKQIHIVVTKE